MKNNPYNGFLRDYEINDGEKNFGIKEIEVYQVFFWIILFYFKWMIRLD